MVSHSFKFLSQLNGLVEGGCLSFPFFSFDSFCSGFNSFFKFSEAVLLLIELYFLFCLNKCPNQGAGRSAHIF